VCAALGSDYKEDKQGNLIFNTYICHGGDSEKLYYYCETKTFRCYTCSSSYDIFELVRRAKGFHTFGQAYYWILEFFHWSTTSGFTEKVVELTDDWSILHKLRSYNEMQETAELKPINQNMVNLFGDPILPEEWEKENIDFDTCKKYGIRIDSSVPRIIIPHKDIHGNIVGIRGRTYNPFELENGGKYMPICLEGQWYSHPLGSNLYGLYENAETIKKLKKVVIFESEKSVLMIDHFYKGNNFSVAVCGSSLSQTQINLLLSLGVEEITLAFDKENDNDDESKQTLDYEAKLLKLVQPYASIFDMYVVFDYDGLLGPKDSPIDKGKEIFEQLLSKKIYIPSIESNDLKPHKRKSNGTKIKGY
jgi:hypothetical protein